MKKVFYSLVIVIGFLGFDWQTSASTLDDDLFGNTSNGKIFMEGEFLDDDLLRITVRAEKISTPVLGLAFHLQYDGDRLAFLRYEPGSFLEKGGDPFYLVKDEPIEQELIFGETLKREDSFPVGGDVVSTFYFQIIEDGEFIFRFDQGVVSTLDTVRQDIDNISWENFLISRNDQKALGAGKELADEIEASVGSNNLSFDHLEWILPILGSGLITTLFIIYLKNQEKKRHGESVNFK